MKLLCFALIGIVFLAGCESLEVTRPTGGNCGVCRNQLYGVCSEWNPDNGTGIRECEAEWRYVCDVHC